MTAEVAAKIKHYLELNASEPLTLRQIAAVGACTLPPTKEEETALLRLLESEAIGLTYKDIPILKGDETTRVYWRKRHSKDKYHMKSKCTTPSAPDRTTSLLLASDSVLQPSLSRRPFVSPAKNERSGRRPAKTTALSSKSLSSTPQSTGNTTWTRDGATGSLEEAASLSRDVLKLKEMVARVESEVCVMAEEYSEKELQDHIDKLHEYNEMRDIGQILLGKLAEVEGITTTVLYQRFGLDLNS